MSAAILKSQRVYLMLFVNMTQKGPTTLKNTEAAVMGFFFTSMTQIKQTLSA